MFSRARLRVRPSQIWRAQVPRCSRQFASQTTSASTASHGQSGFGAFGGLIQEMDKFSPRFEVKPGQIEILKSPAEFYITLKSKILAAKKHIYLSTLYVGKTEYELIDTIRQALKENPELKVSILTDALRGTRETPKQSCASLLAPLISEFGADRIEIRMFHTPNLTGLRKAVIPNRINEGWGLQHMKLYGVDDELILSGANLSEDYFSNRQDRYHLFKCAAITQYFRELQSAVCSLSFKISPSAEPQGYTISWPDSNNAPSPLENVREFGKRSTAFLAPIIRPGRTPTTSNSLTIVYPLAQFTPLLKPDTSTELPALEAVLNALAIQPLCGSSWTFTAGYFNMTPSVRRLLLATNAARGTVIAASPWANGFFGSAGVSGMLPDAYTLLSKRFVDSVRRKDLSSQITLKEWRRGTIGEADGWTYHAKGLWVTAPGESRPSVTIVGSSNYTKRSYTLDLEANVMIVTRDADLQKRLAEEEMWLQEYASPMTSADYDKPERHVGIKVRLAMWAVRVLGGAL